MSITHSLESELSDVCQRAGCRCIKQQLESNNVSSDAQHMAEATAANLVNSLLYASRRQLAPELCWQPVDASCQRKAQAREGAPRQGRLDVVEPALHAGRLSSAPVALGGRGGEGRSSRFKLVGQGAAQAMSVWGRAQYKVQGAGQA